MPKLRKDMRNPKKAYCLAALALTIAAASCKLPAVVTREASKAVPAVYGDSAKGSSAADQNWRDYFKDPYLAALIDTALRNNQELNIANQEIAITRNEIRIRQGEYLPFVGLRAGAGADKVSRNTPMGAVERDLQIRPGRENPEPLGDFVIGAYASWEVDIWRKLRNGKKAAVARYLASAEGRNFTVTNLVAEIANSYYELLALHSQLDIARQNIGIQTNALKIVKLEKEAAKVTELAVRKFEAEVLKTQSLQYDIQQQIVEAENRINFLMGRFPQPIAINPQDFSTLTPSVAGAGLPADLLSNRPDIRQAEQELLASKLDVKIAKAEFYPQLRLTASAGYQAFNPKFLFQSPESLLFSLAGELVAPLINRNAIKSVYSSANARQMQAVYEYERRILNGYIEVVNQLSNIDNLQKSYGMKAQQVQALTRSIDISNDLFRSARADYMEILLTQRDALEARLELIETKKEQMNAMVNVYQALGGGWK